MPPVVLPLTSPHNFQTDVCIQGLPTSGLHTKGQKAFSSRFRIRPVSESKTASPSALPADPGKGYIAVRKIPSGKKNDRSLRYALPSACSVHRAHERESDTPAASLHRQMPWKSFLRRPGLFCSHHGISAPHPETVPPGIPSLERSPSIHRTALSHWSGSYKTPAVWVFSFVQHMRQILQKKADLPTSAPLPGSRTRRSAPPQVPYLR